ncbi:MAG: adenylate/guanylate cyclase protein [Marmoricola sp.]|nr:adenylate/guanylate cyclase protein [Marmoricola sp.]
MTAPEDLERAIMGAVADLTGAEVAARAGLSVKEAQRLWRALGFAEAGDAPAFSSADAEALDRVASMGRAGALDFDTLVRMTRAVGTTMDRLAAWEVATLAGGLDRSVSGDSQRDEALRLVQAIGQDFEGLVVYVWRRHLAAAIARVESVDVAEEQLAEATVGFADLVSFSELTNKLDDDEIGNLVEVFETRSHDVVARRRGRMVKTLGDSVLFMAPTPADGMEIAWDIVRVIGGDPRLPDVRAGVVTGSVVLRMGDVYGPAVNLAARLTGVARRNRVITDTHTAERLPTRRFETRTLPARPVRGFGDLQPVAVRRTQSR